MTTVITASAERRKRLKLKRIVISEQNYHALKRLGYAGDSFNDVISKLLRIEKNCQEKRQQELQQQRQQQESDDRNNSTSSGGLPFPGSLSELFEQDRQQEGDLIRLLQKRKSRSTKA